MVDSSRFNPQSYSHCERGCTIGHNPFRVMAQQKKKSQVATIKTKLLCMDAEVQASKVFTPGDKINAEVEYVDEDNLRITQNQPKAKKEKQPAPERKFKDLIGSLHGKISKTDFGVTLHLYVRHGEYKNARVLADIFESETEQMCDVLGDMELGEEADQCDR